MRLSEQHELLDDEGRGKCSVPMWSGGCPAGFCDREAYGNRPEGKEVTRWDGHTYRLDGRYAGYIPALACPLHGGPESRVFKDGTAWVAVMPDFINLQESPAGFGDTPEEARANLGVFSMRKHEDCEANGCMNREGGHASCIGECDILSACKHCGGSGISPYVEFADVPCTFCVSIRQDAEPKPTAK